MTVIQFLLLRTASDPSFDSGTWIRVTIGAVLLVVAYYMPKTRPNFFLGIRTPWTLANEEVWFRTHRQGAWWFAATGIATILSAPFQIGWLVLVGVLVTATLWLAIYSYIAYARVKGVT